MSSARMAMVYEKLYHAVCNQNMNRVVTVTLDREHGSLFDAWLRYGLLDDMQPQDIRYLRDIVHPHRAVQYYECSEGSIELKLQMLPHEVKFLTILLEL